MNWETVLGGELCFQHAAPRHPIPCLDRRHPIAHRDDSARSLLSWKQWKLRLVPASRT
jgi:hypothetical protein